MSLDAYLTMRPFTFLAYLTLASLLGFVLGSVTR